MQWCIEGTDEVIELAEDAVTIIYSQAGDVPPQYYHLIEVPGDFPWEVHEVKQYLRRRSGGEQ